MRCKQHILTLVAEVYIDWIDCLTTRQSSIKPVYFLEFRMNPDVAVLTQIVNRHHPHSHLYCVSCSEKENAAVLQLSCCVDPSQILGSEYPGLPLFDGTPNRLFRLG